MVFKSSDLISVLCSWKIPRLLARVAATMKVVHCTCLQMELFPPGIITLLRPPKTHLTTDPKPTQWSQDIQVLTCTPSEHAKALFDRTLLSITQTFNALKIVSAKTTNTSQRTNNCSEQKEAVTNNYVRAGLRPSDRQRLLKETISHVNCPGR